ncbi:MAG: LamG-like jellyroll fold domain-containing protein, partial [Candidatus Kapaibacterium sp.]
MRLKVTYCFLLLTLVLSTRDGLAQAPLCNPNMVMTPNASSFVVIPNPKGIALPGAFTIEFWAQSSSFVPFSGLLEQGNNGNTGPFSIRFTSGSSLTIALTLNTGSATLTTPNIQNVQNWQHYAVTFIPNDTIRFY